MQSDRVLTQNLGKIGDQIITAIVNARPLSTLASEPKFWNGLSKIREEAAVSLGYDLKRGWTALRGAMSQVGVFPMQGADPLSDSLLYAGAGFVTTVGTLGISCPLRKTTEDFYILPPVAMMEAAVKNGYRFDPMTPDELRVVNEVLSGINFPEWMQASTPLSL